jgi:hypothetical protein
VTAVALTTLDGPNVTLADESALETVPPSLGEITVGGGESPLAVFAFGSGWVVVASVAGEPVDSDDVVPVVGVPAMTVMVPVPVVAPAGGVVAFAPVSGGIVGFAVSDEVDVWVVSGVEPVVSLEGTVTGGVVWASDPVVVVLVELPVVSVVVVGRVGSTGSTTMGAVVDEAGSDGVVSVVVADVTVDGSGEVTFVSVVEVDDAWFRAAFSWSSAACAAAACAAAAWSAADCCVSTDGCAAPWDDEAAGSTGGIGSGVVSGTAIVGSATPVASSYVGRFASSFVGVFGAGLVTYEFVTTGTVTEPGAFE